MEGNLRFVITVAKQYQNQGLDLSDLIAEGNFGLMKAINNFDWTKKLRFISYAVWWVKQSILQSLNENARTIRLPVNVVQELHRAKKEVENVSEKFNKVHRKLFYNYRLKAFDTDQNYSLYKKKIKNDVYSYVNILKDFIK